MMEHVGEEKLGHKSSHKSKNIELGKNLPQIFEIPRVARN
jgi:hypothetical protein